MTNTFSVGMNSKTLTAAVFLLIGVIGLIGAIAFLLGKLPYVLTIEAVLGIILAIIALLAGYTLLKEARGY